MAVDEVEKLAYELWEREGRPEGRHEVHYFDALRMLARRELSDAPPPVKRTRRARNTMDRQRTRRKKMTPDA